MKHGRGAAGSARGGATASTINANHHALGHVAMSPFILIIIIAALTVAVWIFTTAQITNTESSAFTLLQQTVYLDPHMTGQQVQQFLNGKMDYYQNIAGLIGWGVQIALWLTTFSPTGALASMHRRFNVDVSPSLMATAYHVEKWRIGIQRALVVGDVLTDFFYVVKDHNLIPGMNGILPIVPSSTWGVLVVAILFPAVLCYVTVFGLKFDLFFVEMLIDHWTPAQEV